MSSIEEEDELLGGAVGGVHRDETSRIVANLLKDLDGPVEITIRPESLPQSHHYTIEWQYLEFDRDAMEWKPLGEMFRKDRDEP